MLKPCAVKGTNICLYGTRQDILLVYRPDIFFAYYSGICFAHIYQNLSFVWGMLFLVLISEIFLNFWKSYICLFSIKNQVFRCDRACMISRRYWNYITWISYQVTVQDMCSVVKGSMFDIQSVSFVLFLVLLPTNSWKLVLSEGQCQIPELVVAQISEEEEDKGRFFSIRFLLLLKVFFGVNVCDVCIEGYYTCTL